MSAIPLLHDVPLNAVELPRALAEDGRLLRADGGSGSPVRRAAYFEWLKPYLFYFDVCLDNRHGVPRAPQRLMLVPIGAKRPTIFQRTIPLSGMIYTHSVSSFYAAPHNAPSPVLSTYVSDHSARCPLP